MVPGCRQNRIKHQQVIVLHRTKVPLYSALACNNFVQEHEEPVLKWCCLQKTLGLMDRGAGSFGSPDMNGLQTDETKKLRREALIQVGNGLREHYSDVLKEAIPNRFADLLRRLVAPCEAGCQERLER
jgi:Anti-sigma factor NepR